MSLFIHGNQYHGANGMSSDSLRLSKAASRWMTCGASSTGLADHSVLATVKTEYGAKRNSCSAVPKLLRHIYMLD